MNVDIDYIRREGDALHQLDRRTVLGRLDALEDAELLDVLQQRRYIALHFTLFCDVIMCALDDERARKVVADIVRLEYAETNHRDDFVRELMTIRGAMRLPAARRDVVSHEVTPASRATAGEIIALANDVAGSRSDLACLVVLRFFGEVTPGHEFKKLSFALRKRALLEQDQSVFLYPHVEFDENGIKGPAGQADIEAHAAQYLSSIVDRIGGDDDWAVVDAWLARSRAIRERFYLQFERAGTAVSG